MRTIKFRGKRAFIGGWLYGLLDIQGNSVEIFSRENNTFSKGIVIPKTIGQFTGLYDKNGKEIYEGDILKFNHFAEQTNERHFVAGGNFRSEDVDSIYIDEYKGQVVFTDGCFKIKYTYKSDHKNKRVEKFTDINYYLMMTEDVIIMDGLAELDLDELDYDFYRERIRPLKKEMEHLEKTEIDNVDFSEKMQELDSKIFSILKEELDKIFYDIEIIGNIYDNPELLK